MVGALVLACPFLGLVWLFRRDAQVDGRREWWMWLIPGALAIYLVVRWLFVQQTVMIEGERNWRALDASAAIVRRHWWRAIGVMIVIAIIEAGPIMIASATALAPALVEAITTSAVSALVLPFATAAQTLLYYDLRARKEQADDNADRLAAAEPDVSRESP